MDTENSCKKGLTGIQNVINLYSLQKPTTEDEMTKNDKREIQMAVVYANHGQLDTAARSLSALYRKSRGFDQDDIKAVAESLGVRWHIDFITG